MVAGNIRFQDILDFISQDMLCDGDQDISRKINRYILTSSCCCFGAAEILNETTLEKIYEQIGDFILLPCSVHETILIPESQFGDDYECFVEMVKEVNETSLEPEERLSNHVYVYHGQGEGLRIAA